jgi:hypothetical protein
MSTNKDRANLWLAAKVPGASFNQVGIASIQRDPDTQLILELSPSEEVCHFCAIIAPLDEQMPEVSLLTALELNRFGKPLGGCWLAWEPDIQMLTLCWNLELADADEISFSNAIDNFIAAIDSARSELMPQSEEPVATVTFELA